MNVQQLISFTTESRKEDSMKVIVTGDVAVDRVIAHTCPSEHAHWTDHAAYVNDLPGGACLLAELIRAAADELAKYRTAAASQSAGQQIPVPDIIGPDFEKLLAICDNEAHTTYSLWEPKPRVIPPKSKDDDKVWRASRYLGRNKNPDETCTETGGVLPSDEQTPDADLVVLDDGGFGFRDNEALWLSVIKTAPSGLPPWVLVKMSLPIARGPLWERLFAGFADRMVVMMTVGDLRLTEVKISQEFSWEQTAQDLAWELVHNPRVNALSKCAHVVVSFGAAGAVLMSKDAKNKDASPSFRLFFDPGAVEGSWELAYRGGVPGGGSCLTAALALQILMSREEPCLEAGIQSGLAAIRTLYENGYGQYKPGAIAALSFPTQSVAARMFKEARLSLARNSVKQATQEDEPGRITFLRSRADKWTSEDERKELSKDPFAEAKVVEPLYHLAHPDLVPEARLAQPRWTILEENTSGSLEQLARDIVEGGPTKALNRVPLGQFSKLLTVERGEIESFRSVRNLIAEYDRSEHQKRPLSIAVFGAPGAGKSFGITQVAKSLFPERIEPLTFNLSQFTAADDLLAALHRVRDVGLGGKLPLVFWDEFDTSLGQTELGWLRLFLAPMQDGSFQEGQVTHPIGKAIFVFAGGTSTTMEAFRDRSPDKQAAFISAKGPDFVSRLKGYINIIGPNPRANSDLQYVVRRAILLRVLLGDKAPQIFERPEKPEGKVNIDPGILNAFLKIGAYRHGARSMEAIIDMSGLSRSTRFERSSLPDEAQLELHVDSREFMARVQEAVIDAEALEILASAAHEVYREGERERGKLRTDQDVEFTKLTTEDQEQNRENARDIPTKLNLAGYIMIPARGKAEPFEFPGDDLEQLAEWEHVRWMREKLARDWRYAPETVRDSRRNNCLVPWSELPESEKAKDRGLVVGIPKILKQGGYAVFQLPDAVQRRRKAQYRLDYHLTRVGVIGPDASLERDRCFPYVRQALEGIAKAFGTEGLTVISQLVTTAEQLVAERMLHNSTARLFVPLSQETPDKTCAALPDATLRAGCRDLCARADQLITPKQIQDWLHHSAARGLAPVTEKAQQDRYVGLQPGMAYVLGNCDVLIAFGDELPSGSSTAQAVALARQDKLPLVLLPAAPAPIPNAIQVKTENFPLIDEPAKEQQP